MFLRRAAARFPFIVFIVVFPLFLVSSRSSASSDLSYDVVIVGAGTGGCSAAVQAARMGCRVALAEETGSAGGQLTACGVTTFDDQTLNRSGIYREYIGRLNAAYRAMKVNNAICYWGADTISGSPGLEENVFLEMLKEAEGVDLYFHMTPEKVYEKNGAVTGIRFLDGQGRKTEMKCKVLIDATECGDVLPLTSARYRAGNSVSPRINPDAEIQDITWVALIRRYKSRIPEKFSMERQPRLYSALKKRFSEVVAIGGADWHRGSAPYNVRTFNAYRAIPDPDWNLPVVGDDAGTWGNITATALNWCNDYPGTKSRGDRGLTARYLEDRAYRRAVNSAALEFTIALLYYYHHDLKQRDWAIDDRNGYAKKGDSLGRTTDRVPEGYEAVARAMPPLPYVRESRRLLGITTLTVSDMRRDLETGKAQRNHPTAIALGEYPIDIHGSHEDRCLEADLGESSADFNAKWTPGLFQVPLECLIPEKLNGFLTAEKNISVSRMVNGAIRLHPITMLTGQAAGTLAALSVKYGVSPRSVPAVLVQSQLLKDGSRLALANYRDVEPTSANWPAVQASALYGFLARDPSCFFAPALSVRKNDLSAAFKKLFHGLAAPASFQGDAPLTHREFTQALQAVPELKNLKTVRRLSRSLLTVKRGEAVQILWNMLVERAVLQMKKS